MPDAVEVFGEGALGLVCGIDVVDDGVVPVVLGFELLVGEQPLFKAQKAVNKPSKVRVLICSLSIKFEISFRRGETEQQFKCRATR